MDELVLAEASLTIKEDLAGRSRAQVAALLTDLRDPNAMAAEQNHRWAWLRGLAALRSKRGNEAVRELTEASRRARVEIGPRHPDVARIDIALAVARRQVTGGVTDPETASKWREADSTLRIALPSLHPMLGYLDGLGGAAQDDQDAVRMITLAASLPFPESFVP
jgi:hypothetical protein